MYCDLIRNVPVIEILLKWDGICGLGKREVEKMVAEEVEHLGQGVFHLGACPKIRTPDGDVKMKALAPLSAEGVGVLSRAFHGLVGGIDVSGDFDEVVID